MIHATVSTTFIVCQVACGVEPYKQKIDFLLVQLMPLSNASSMPPYRRPHADRAGMHLLYRLVLATLALPLVAHAANLTLQITDATAQPAVDVVAYAEPASGQVLPKPAHGTMQIEQKARRFAPIVTVIQTGTAISFPNHDSVRHQVYSFSPAKVFELKLYSGAGGEPVIFDKPGTVIVGCNIHDQMAAYIQIVDTPWFGKSDATGKLVLDNLIPGKYRLKIWHPNLPAGTAASDQLVTIGSSDQTIALAVPFKTQR